MSYNIDNWKTKKLENLIIPLSAFFIGERKDWHPYQPRIVDAETMSVSMSCGCGQVIEGKLVNGELHVTGLKMAGEGSGSFMRYVFYEALKKSKGELEAVLVWEEGDSISRLTVKDGVLEETGADL